MWTGYLVYCMMTLRFPKVKKKSLILLFMLIAAIYYFVLTLDGTHDYDQALSIEGHGPAIVEDAFLRLANSSYFRGKRMKYNFGLFDHDISPWNSGHGDPFLVIMVPSVPRRRKRRQAIRDTWGSIAHNRKWPGSELQLRLNLIFLVGHSNYSNEEKIVEEDSDNFGDILRGTFVDSYYNLTLKVLTGLNFVKNRYPNAEYILKADDDTFNNIDLLVRILQRIRPKNTVIGYIHPTGPVARTGMWKLSPKSYPFAFYPAYATGNAYVISADMAVCICQGAALFPYISIEDAFITGILAVHCNSSRLHLDGFTHWKEYKMSPEEFVERKKITMNDADGVVDREIWTYLTRLKTTIVLT